MDVISVAKAGILYTIRNTWWFLSNETMQLMCFHAYVIDILKQCVWKRQNCVIMTWAQVDLRHCYDDLQLDLNFS